MDLSELKQKLTAVSTYVRGELSNIRTGKASPSLVENLVVETYGGTTKLKLMELSTISVDGPAALLISPFDPSTVSDIEKAILASPLHLTPRVDGKNIHIKIPALTEEQRQNMLKLISQKIEEGKERLRANRDEARRKIKSAFEKKELSEDERFRSEKEIDKVVHDYSEELELLEEKKEKEIIEI